MDDDQDFTIDPELWLAYMLAVSGDEQEKKKLVDRIALKTGVLPEKAELIIDAAIEFLMNKSRSN